MEQCHRRVTPLNMRDAAQVPLNGDAGDSKSNITVDGKSQRGGVRTREAGMERVKCIRFCREWLENVIASV
jgi:hypothetical protein